MSDDSNIHSDIASNLNQSGFNVKAQDVAPTTSTIPFPHTNALQEIGAQIVNQDDLDMGLKDLEYMTEADLKHGDKNRMTESKNPLKILMGKLMRKKGQNQEIVSK